MAWREVFCCPAHANPIANRLYAGWQRLNVAFLHLCLVKFDVNPTFCYAQQEHSPPGEGEWPSALGADGDISGLTLIGSWKERPGEFGHRTPEPVGTTGLSAAPPGRTCLRGGIRWRRGACHRLISVVPSGLGSSNQGAALMPVWAPGVTVTLSKRVELAVVALWEARARPALMALGMGMVTWPTEAQARPSGET